MLADVPASFAALHDTGDHLALWDGELFPGLRYTWANLGDANEARNHFQGIQRLYGRHGKYLVLSGSDHNEPASHVFLARLESRLAGGPWNTNLLTSKQPPKADTVVAAVGLDRTFWHGGGMGLLGDVLAVPLESDEAAKVMFLCLADPTAPARLPIDIDCGRTKAGATSLARLPDGRFLLLVYREVTKRPRGRYDWCVSASDDLFDGFATVHSTGVHAMLEDGRDPQYQTVALLPSGTRADRLYLLATENDNLKAPLEPGTNLADLYEVDLAAFDAAATPAAAPQLHRVASRTFQCPADYGNFRAAVGAHVDERRGLSLYCAYHWRVEHRIRAMEFRERGPSAAPPIEDLAESWIELYEHPDFQGRRLSILGGRDGELADYRRLFVQGSDFNDRISSVRYQLPAESTYRLFRDSGFKLTAADYAYDLVGDGVPQEIPRLTAVAPRLEDSVSSSRFA